MEFYEHRPTCEVRIQTGETPKPLPIYNSFSQGSGTASAVSAGVAAFIDVMNVIIPNQIVLNTSRDVVHRAPNKNNSSYVAKCAAIFLRNG